MSASTSVDAGPLGKVDISGDGGVFKEILKPGTGTEKAVKGDKINVHYVGTLEADGSEFDSSRGRGEPFVFTLGQGAVIKGWDAAVATMLEGELARVTIRADYGYGDGGSPPKIPGGATLVFDIELLGWRSEADLSGDRGVTRAAVVSEGEGWATPKAEDEVLVNVVGRVDTGTDEVNLPFYTSPEGGDEFTLGDGFLCRAVALAVGKMKKGGEVRLVVKPEYGFGEAGRDPGVPPGASLRLDVTLRSWKKVEKVTPDGGVVKKTLADSEDWQRPNPGATVTVAYVGRLADGAVFDERSAEDPLVFATEEDQAPCEGFELAVMQMKRGERALVTLSPGYAAGAPHPMAPALPADAPLTYEIALAEFVKAKDTWDMSPEEKVEAAAATKEKGNAAFKAGNTGRALKLWERAQQAVEHDTSFSQEQKAKAKELSKSLHLNLAAAYLREGRSAEARKAADKVLAADPYHLKALYRRAQAWLATSDWVECGQDVKAGLGVDPGSADFKALSKRLRVAEAASTKKEAALWAGSFKKMARAADKGKEPAEWPVPAPAAEGTAGAGPSADGDKLRSHAVAGAVEADESEGNAGGTGEGEGGTGSGD